VAGGNSLTNCRIATAYSLSSKEAVPSIQKKLIPGILVLNIREVK
jgi:hypothetical protein